MERIEELIGRIKGDIQEGKSGEEIFYTLSPILGRDDKEDEEIFEGLATIPHPEIVRLLQMLLKTRDRKKELKVLKRSLFRLKTKGLTVEESPLPPGESILRPLRAEPPQGFGSGIDFRGYRLLLLVVPHAGRRWDFMEGTVSDLEGLGGFSKGDVTRREFRDLYVKIREESPFPIVEMEPSYVGFLLDQAYHLTVRRGRAVPPEYPRTSGEIEKLRVEYEKPLIYGLLSAVDIDGDALLLDRSGDLLKSDLLESWKIEEDIVRPYAEAALEAEESKIVLSPGQKEARFHEIYQKALSDLFSGERRLLFKRRLEETAYVFLKLGKEEDARTALAAALDLEKPLNPFRPNPFLFQITIKSILPILREVQEKRRREPSFILKP